MACKFYVSLFFFFFGLATLATLGHARTTPGFDACRNSKPLTLNFYGQIILEGERSCRTSISKDGKTYAFSCKLTTGTAYDSYQIGVIEGVVSRVVYESGSTRDFITDTFTIELKDGPELFTFNSKGVINIQKEKNVFPVNGGIFGEDTIVGRFVQEVIYSPPSLLLKITATLYIMPYSCGSISMKVE
ncbi:uncharacterized protein LOC9650989 [Selaginella moellendorffii]|uniref:uncharacterized protein LOC9650989 n=1 Tax=Selaginella moellendorffii TaxID=88036 RepID=UPI000D1CEC8D|nr:uncharacterized protein LOC9650989 [Selaginella moellendorffii]|eukprot:XP_024529783.1 uncharacterized protein LOC9650989 [Selaginella moellendorffii]